MKYLVALVLALLLLSWAGRLGAADPPLPEQPNEDLFSCCVGLSPAFREIIDSGVVRWSYAANPVCSGSLLPDVEEALAAISREKGVSVIYDELAPMRIYLNCGPDFVAVCGGAPVAACLGRGFPYRVQIDLSSVMTGYFHVTRVSIVLHEIMHALAVWNEQYNVSCLCANPGWRDFMNTGPDARHYFEYVEDQRWARSFDPCYGRACEAGLGANDGGDYVWWRNAPRGRTVAILACLPDGAGGCGSYWWTGVVVLSNGQPFQGWHLAAVGLGPDELVCLNRENGGSVSWGRNDLCLGPP